MSILEIQHLSKQFGKNDPPALNDVSLTLERGRIYALVGNNGAGKTTLLRLIMGLMLPTAGSTRLFGSTTARENEKARARVGALIETPIFDLTATGSRTLDDIRVLKGIKNKAAVHEALDACGLSGQGKKRALKYSMGMKQRLALACAMLGEPELLLLDEPFNGLDPAGMREMEDKLRALCEEKGVTILISSHYLKQLYGFATDYIILDRGRLLETLTAEELDLKCDYRLLLKVPPEQQKDACRVLAEKYDSSTVSVLPTGEICVDRFNSTLKSADVLLVNERIDASDMRVAGLSLEEYFLQLTGGAK